MTTLLSFLERDFTMSISKKKVIAIIMMLVLVGVTVVGCGTSTKKTPSVDGTQEQESNYQTTENETETTMEQVTSSEEISEETLEESSEGSSKEETSEESSEETSNEESSEEEIMTDDFTESEQSSEETMEESSESEEIESSGEEETTEETTTEEVTTEEETTTQASVSLPSILGTVRVGSLKGPTSMGLVAIMDMQENGKTSQNYEFTMVTAADELVSMVATGKVDIALLPANVASVLYKKTNGNVAVIDINTLGVLYIVEGGNTIKSISDLKGKTIYMTGKGTTPEYCIRYLLSQHGLTDADVALEFKSEATEVAAIVAKTDGAIGLLPQPFVTTAMTNNSDLRIALDLTKEWNQVADSSMVTGVTIVQKSFLEQQPEAVEDFLAYHQYSLAAGNADLDKTAQLIEHFGIIKAPIAQKAYPYCNIVCITGTEMKQALSGYLKVLYEQNPASIGGSLPDEAFYLMY